MRSPEQSPPDRKIQTVIDNYLSAAHRDSPEEGCIIPALSSEISRQSEDVRQVFTTELTGFCEFISTLVGEDKNKSIAIISAMVGSLLLARSVNDPNLSNDILDAGKYFAKELVSR